MRTIERQLRAKQGAVSLNEKELARLMEATFDTSRLEQVRDLFIFASFTGLHYQKLKALRKENIHTKYGQQWILMAREQTDTLIHVPLLPVPQMIIRKYAKKFMDTDEVLPVPSNQRLNAYLKEIGISAGTVCRMLGRFDLRGRHAYVTDRVIKREMGKVVRNCVLFEKIAALYLLSPNKSVYRPTN